MGTNHWTRRLPRIPWAHFNSKGWTLLLIASTIEQLQYADR